MGRKQFVYLVGLPLLSFAAYVVARLLLPAEYDHRLYAENGPVEIGTAIFFALAGCGALMLGLKIRSVSNAYRVLFFLFGVAAWWVALEEIDYGQTLFGWKTPVWFAENNHHHEMNLHNMMGNRPSHWLKHIAGYGSLVGFVIVPALAMLWSGSYKPGHWTHYMLPRNELFTVVALAQLCEVLWGWGSGALGTYWHQGWNELREFYWGMAALYFVMVMRQRLISPRDANVADSLGVPGARAGAPMRKVA